MRRMRIILVGGPYHGQEDEVRPGTVSITRTRGLPMDIDAESEEVVEFERSTYKISTVPGRAEPITFLYQDPDDPE